MSQIRVTDRNLTEKQFKENFFRLDLIVDGFQTAKNTARRLFRQKRLTRELTVGQRDVWENAWKRIAEIADDRLKRLRAFEKKMKRKFG